MSVFSHTRHARTNLMSRKGRQSTATYAIASRRKTVLDVSVIILDFYRTKRSCARLRLRHVEGRLDALVDMSVSTSDATMLHKLRDLQGDTIARLRATFEAQQAVKVVDDE